jgi:hypothetical protein
MKCGKPSSGGIADSELRDAYVRFENVFSYVSDDAYVAALATRRDGQDRHAALRTAQHAAQNALLLVPAWIIEAAVDLAGRDWLLEQRAGAALVEAGLGLMQASNLVAADANARVQEAVRAEQMAHG